jgi:predicted aspartyl protease
MDRKILKTFSLLLLIGVIEIVIYFAVLGYKKTSIEAKYKLDVDVIKLNQEKEKKKLNDDFEKNKYLATGKDAYERIYNSKQNDLVDLIQRLGSEAFPNNWRIEVKVEEFTNMILLVQVDTNTPEPDFAEIVKYIIPVINCSEKYLRNVAVYNRKHQCFLFFDEDALGELMKSQTLSDKTVSDIKNKGGVFTRYNAIKIDFQEKYGHIFIPVIVSGEYGSYECTMMLDTGASMTVISVELAQKTGREDLNNISRKTFWTAKGLMSCPIVQRELVVGSLDKKQSVAVNSSDDTNLLGVDFFESSGYIIDNSSKCIYVWSK